MVSTIIPFRRFFTIEIVWPVTDSVFLIKRRSAAAHVRDPTPVLVAHVEQHALEFNIRVEAQSSAGTIKSECYIRKVFPAFHLNLQKKITFPIFII